MIVIIGCEADEKVGNNLLISIQYFCFSMLCVVSPILTILGGCMVHCLHQCLFLGQHQSECLTRFMESSNFKTSKFWNVFQRVGLALWCMAWPVFLGWACFWALIFLIREDKAHRCSGLAHFMDLALGCFGLRPSRCLSNLWLDPSPSSPNFMYPLS